MALVQMILMSIPVLCSLGIIIGFFISTGSALKKFDCLDPDVQTKLLFLEYYMAVVRNFSKEDLIKISKLSDEEIQYFNTIHLYNERMQIIREKIKRGFLN